MTVTTEIDFDTAALVREAHRQYLALAQIYVGIRPRLDALLTEMDILRRGLDTPPFNDPAGPAASVYAAVYTATRQNVRMEDK